MSTDLCLASCIAAHFHSWRKYYYNTQMPDFLQLHINSMKFRSDCLTQMAHSHEAGWALVERYCQLARQTLPEHHVLGPAQAVL